MSTDLSTGRNVLHEVWNGQRSPLSRWVRAVSEAVEASGLDNLDAAEAAGVTVAELDAVTRLALLDDATLEAVSLAEPNITTWFLLTELGTEDLLLVLERAAGISDAPSDYQRLVQARTDLDRRLSVSAIQNVEPDVLEFAVGKARAYSVWDKKPKHYKALYDFATRRRSGGVLTPAQTAYAEGLLKELVEAGAVRIPSPDGDDELCERVIQLVG